MRHLYEVKPDNSHVFETRYCNNMAEVRAAVANNRQYGDGSNIKLIRFGIDSSQVIINRHIPLRDHDYPFDLSPDSGID